MDKCNESRKSKGKCFMWSYFAIGMAVYVNLVAILYLKDVKEVRKGVMAEIACVVINAALLGHLIVDELGGVHYLILFVLMFVCLILAMNYSTSGGVTREEGLSTTSASGGGTREESLPTMNVSMNVKRGSSDRGDSSGLSMSSPNDSFCGSGGFGFGCDSDD
ncbi:MAG: hypothetical protein JKY54_17315 [Flavobacteriales bacterium]|nr:hypothetical protein [Flavobacteriales bacterium]